MYALYIFNSLVIDHPPPPPIKFNLLLIYKILKIYNILN